MKKSGTQIYFQNENGFEHDLDGVYLSQDGMRRYTFNSKNGTAFEEYRYGLDSEWTTSSLFDGCYASVNDIYFLYKEKEYSECYSFEVSEDKNTITEDGIVYIKQGN